MPSLQCVVPVKFFHFVPAKSSEAKPSLRFPFMSGRLYCLTSTESKSCSSSATSASAISVFTRLSDKSVKLVLQTTLPVLPAITRQPEFRWFVVRDSCVERLFCTSASSLIMISSHWCAPPSRSRKTRALWLPSSRSSGPLSGAALLLDTCSLLQPAQFFVRKRSSEKSEVLVTVSVLEAKSCGAETVPELVTSPRTTLPVDTPPLVAVKVQSRLSQSSGPAEAAPVTVSVAPVSAPVAAKLAAVAAPDAVSVPVDTSPAVVKFPALAVLLMVRVLPVIPVAELSRPTLAAPLMLSELPDTAPVDDSAAPATVPVAVHLVGPSVVRKAHGYLQRRGRLRDSELAGEEAVYLCDGVVAEQRGCDARRRRRVLVGGRAVRHQRRGDLVGGEDVLVRARPVGQQRARDGGLRLRVLRACCAVVSQQRVHLRRGVVRQQRGRDGAGRLRVLRRSGASKAAAMAASVPVE